jgi:hypothetical protein
MESSIYIVLMDDWELFGNGTGDVYENQVAPMKKLLAVYDRYEIKSTFNVEVMQQLSMLKLSGQYQKPRGGGGTTASCGKLPL